MKIAILQSFYHPETNGVASYIDGLYGALLEKQPELEIEIIALDTRKTEKYEEKIGHFVVHRLACWTFLHGTYAIPSFAGCRKLRKLLKAGNYDWINTHTRFFLLSFLAIRLGGKMQIKTLHTEHGSGFVQHGNKFVEFCAWLFDRTLGGYVLRHANLVTGVSKSVCTFAEKLGAKQAIEMYNGIEIDFWKEETSKAATRNQLKVSQNEVAVVFVGRLVPSKGCQDLIAALGGTSLPWKLLVIGDGFFQKNLEELTSKLKLKDKVFFLGRKSKTDIRAILQAAELFVNPSFAAEGMPTTVLEAAACGCACLSSDLGGAVEVIGKGNVFPVRDIEKMREKILDYANIKKTNPTEFDWKKIAEKFFQLLKIV